MKLFIAVSNSKDGNMKALLPNDQQAHNNRKKFLEKNNINPRDTTLLYLNYKRANYAQYISIDEHNKGDGIVRDHALISDALIVTKPNHALFLPLADCIGAVIFDPKNNILMLSHLGRHNLIDKGGIKSIKYLKKTYNSNPKDLIIEFSPSAGKKNYPLFDFDNQSLTEIASKQMLSAGVDKNNIKIPKIDTTSNKKYFSHSQFLTGKRQEDARFAIVAVIKD
jgi:copper oxidase (laccase) domain-containing protein